MSLERHITFIWARMGGDACVRMWGSDAHDVTLNADGVLRRDAHVCGKRVLIRFELAQVTVVTPFQDHDGQQVLYQL